MSNLIDKQAAIDLWDKYHPTIAVDAMQYDAELRQMPSAQTEQHWIPITERLPKQYQEVLICGGQNIIKCAQLIGNIFECDELDLYGSIDGTRVIDADTFNVLAWMPLPKPYEMKGEENEDD